MFQNPLSNIGRRVTYEDIQERKIGASAANTILNNLLGLRKLLSHFLPQKLNNEQKQQLLEICIKNHEWLSNSGSRVTKMVTSDERAKSKRRGQNIAK